jgi:hypothetical protein
VIPKERPSNALTPDELSYLEKIVKEHTLFLTKHLQSINYPIPDNPSLNMEYIHTYQERKVWNNLREKFQLLNLQKINTTEYENLIQLVEDRLAYMESEVKKLSLKSIQDKKEELKKIEETQDSYIEEAIKLTIIKSKLHP